MIKKEKDNIMRKVLSSLCLCITCAFVLTSIPNISSNTVQAVSSNSSNGQESCVLEINSDELVAVAAKYANVETITGDEAVSHNLKVDDIIFNDSLTNEQKKVYLTQLGVYDVNSEDEVKLADSSSGDVSLNKPTIKYDSKTKQYIITGTGNWRNHDYEVPKWSWWYPKVGSTKNIGGTEALGISLTNTSGSTNGLALNSGYGKFSNGTASKQSTTLATENDNYGGGYKIQDFIKFIKVDNYFLWANTTYYYNAYYMTCVLRYNSNFKNYSGSAKLFYSHTWDNTSITSISVSKTGAGIGWSKTADHWNAYSYARTFSKGSQTN